MYEQEELLGSKVVATNGFKGTVIYCHINCDDEVEQVVIRADKGGIEITVPPEEVRVIERQMYRSRLEKNIEDMGDEELREFLHELRTGRTQAMVASRETHGMRRSKKGQPTTEKGAARKRSTSSSKTKDEKAMEKVESILSPEAMAALKERLKAKLGG